MIHRVSFEKTLELLQEHFGFDADAMYDYAVRDEIGGYHPNSSLAKWPSGSIWEIEGVILYALVRVIRPLSVLEIGTFQGCSTHHIMAALADNRDEFGDDVQMITVDNGTFDGKPDFRGYDFITEVKGDAIEFLKNTSLMFDFIFEDSKHTADHVQATYEAAKGVMNSGGFMLSHDTAHHLVGHQVMDGITRAGFSQPLAILTSPSDCGLSFIQLPEAETMSTKTGGTTHQVNIQSGLSVSGSLNDEETKPVVTNYELPEDDIETEQLDPIPALEDMSMAELRDELSDRGVDAADIQGTGKNNTVKKADLVRTLKKPGRVTRLRQPATFPVKDSDELVHIGEWTLILCHSENEARWLRYHISYDGQLSYTGSARNKVQAIIEATTWILTEGR